MTEPTALITSSTLPPVSEILRRRLRIALVALVLAPVVLISTLLSGPPALFVVVFTISALGLAVWLIAPSWQDWMAWSGATDKPTDFRSQSGRITAVSHAPSGTVLTLLLPNKSLPNQSLPNQSVSSQMLSSQDGLRMSARGFRWDGCRLGDVLELQIYPRRLGRQVVVAKAAGGRTIFGFTRSSGSRSGSPTVS